MFSVWQMLKGIAFIKKLIGNLEIFGAAWWNILYNLNLFWRHPSTCSFSKLFLQTHFKISFIIYDFYSDFLNS